MGRAAWHGFVCFYRSDDLTFASSVAFYALLSLFPFLLLSLSVLGRVSADEQDRAAILGFVLQYFPRQFDFVEELPRHATGKLYKRLLRDRYWGKAEA